MDIKATLRELSEASGVSGYEDEVRSLVSERLRALADEVRVDAMGNVIALRRGYAAQGCGPSVMLAAHMDEIGLMVTVVEKGFIRFTSVGGFDDRVLLGQEVTVHGRRPLPGIIGSRPPHVLAPNERNKVIPREQLLVDVGLPPAEVESLVRAGDLITIQRSLVELRNDLVAGKAFDDRVGVAVILVCLEVLQGMRHAWDVYGVATVQEEVGLKGAMTSAFAITPTVGIALDVTFGIQPGVSDAETMELGKGPAIAFGPNVHPAIFERLKSTAQAYEIPYQVEPIPAETGTDAWAMQVTRAGLPTGLVSIPLRSMHTSVETVSVKDVERAGRLLAHFIAGLDDAFLQALKLD
ncbi:MAG: M42 family metallopeptidase [Anaerolineae bacterium]|nr:M42 family metallopeptidase [Anaerolineae bacterium]MDW8100655.1 M42 family metallopeptidase [Anaerolineae bacterium]